METRLVVEQETCCGGGDMLWRRDLLWRPARSLPAESGCYERNRREVMEFVERMRSDGSLVMNLRLKRKHAGDEEVCAVKKANQDAQR